MTIGELNTLFMDHGFTEKKTWAKLFMRNNCKTLFVGNDGFFSFTTDEGIGNGSTCWLHTHIDDASKDRVLQAIKNSNG